MPCGATRPMVAVVLASTIGWISFVSLEYDGTCPRVGVVVVVSKRRGGGVPWERLEQRVFVVPCPVSTPSIVTSSIDRQPLLVHNTSLLLYQTAAASEAHDRRGGDSGSGSSASRRPSGSVASSMSSSLDPVCDPLLHTVPCCPFYDAWLIILYQPLCSPEPPSGSVVLARRLCRQSRDVDPR